MQAITVKFICPTDHRGARLKAACDRGSITIDYPYDKSSGLDAATVALRALIAKFMADDLIGYSSTERNPWSGPWFGGTTKDGTTVFVNGWHNDGVTVSPAAQ